MSFLNCAVDFTIFSRHWKHDLLLKEADNSGPEQRLDDHGSSSVSNLEERNFSQGD